MRPNLYGDHQLPHLTDVQRVALHPHATRLHDDFTPLLKRLDSISDLTELTRNASALLEKDHVSGAVYSGTDLDFASAESLHLRIFPSRWKYGYALEEHHPYTGDRQHSLQFFDCCGNMLHKIVVNETSDVASFRQLVREHAAADQTQPQVLIAQSDCSIADASYIDVDALRAEWALPHDHDDFLKRHEAFDQQRLRKLRLAGKAFAYQVANESVRAILQRMTDFGTSVMTLVGNAGIVQAYYGKIKNIGAKDSRLRIMNSGFRMLLQEDHIDSVWVAKKPTADGIITSLELFNRKGMHIASFLSKKSGGQPEPREWREAIMHLMPIFGT